MVEAGFESRQLGSTAWLLKPTSQERRMRSSQRDLATLPLAKLLPLSFPPFCTFPSSLPHSLSPSLPLSTHSMPPSSLSPFPLSSWLSSPVLGPSLPLLLMLLLGMLAEPRWPDPCLAWALCLSGAPNSSLAVHGRTDRKFTLTFQRFILVSETSLPLPCTVY